MASNPLLHETGERGEALSTEQLIDRAMLLQNDVGAGLGIAPRALSVAQATAELDQYENLKEHIERADFVQKFIPKYGKHAVQAAAEAKLPRVVSSLAQVVQGFSRGELARLLAAAEANDDNLPPSWLNMDPAKKQALEADVLNSPFLRTLSTISSATHAPHKPNEQDGPDTVYADMAKTLVNYKRMGGNPEDVYKKFTVINTKGMAIIMPRTIQPELIEAVLRIKTHELGAGAAGANNVWIYNGKGMELKGNGDAVKGQDGLPVRMSMAEIWAASMNISRKWEGYTPY